MSVSLSRSGVARGSRGGAKRSSRQVAESLEIHGGYVVLVMRCMHRLLQKNALDEMPARFDNLAILRSHP